MKRIVLVLAISLITMSFVTKGRSAYKVVVNESTIEWKAYKTLGKHNGTIAIKHGRIVLKDNQIVEGSFVIEMNSIKVLDSKKKKLLTHIKSEDFFDVNQFPEAKFVISKSYHKEHKMMLKGMLTIKGITKEIEFPVSITKNEKGQLILESETFKVDRTKFDLTYKSKTFFNNLKDKSISDEFDLKVSVVLSELEK